MTNSTAGNTIAVQGDELMSKTGLKVPKEELRILKSYAKINNCSLSEIIRTTMLSHIEKDYDLRVFAGYEREKENVKTRPVNELWKELGL